MALRNNLQDQLNYLSEHLSECQFNGFQYAPTASSDINIPTVFNFDTQKSNNSKSSSVQSVSNVGFLELQSFRTESSPRAIPSVTTSLASISSFTTEAATSKYATFITETPKPIEEIRPIVRGNQNNTYNSRPLLNIQDEISKFESAIPDSALMDIDIDALVAAELAKSTQKVVSLQPDISSAGSSSYVSSTAGTYSGRQPDSYTAPSGGAHSVPSVSSSSTMRSAFLQETSPAPGAAASHYFSGGSTGQPSSGARTEDVVASGGGTNANVTASANNSAHKQAESQRLQKEMERLSRELNGVNAQLAESLQQSGFYPAPLKRQRAALEEQLEEIALQQHRLLQSSWGSSAVGASATVGAAGGSGGLSSKENHLAHANQQGSTGATVIDLCSAVKSNTFNSNTSYSAPYNVPYSVPSSTNSYHSGGGSGGSAGVSSGLGNSQQLSPQLAAVTRLATSADTPVAVNNYNSNNYNNNHNRASANAPSGNGNYPAYGASSSSSNNYNNNNNFGGNNMGYVSHSLHGNTTAANGASSSNSNARYNPAGGYSSSFTGATATTNASNATYSTHHTNSSSSVVAAPVLSKTSAFARDEFDADFEDAVNDNDFTDWAVGAAPTQDNTFPNYGTGGNHGTNSANNGTSTNSGYVGYQGFGQGAGDGADDGFGDYNGNSYGAGGAGGGGGGGGGGNYGSNGANYGNNYGGNYSTNNRSPAALLDDVPLPLCPCGNLTVLCTSRTEATRGQKFFSCAGARNTEAHCGFFQWEDPAAAALTTNANSSTFNNSAYQGGAGGGGAAVKDHKVEIQERFGHVGFRQGQLGCVEAALSGKDVFCLMPTGGGKSVVYQLPAWCSPGVAVIFSPLISLIQDQVDSMNAIGIRAVFMSSLQENEETQGVIRELLSYCYSSYSRYSSSITDEEARIKMLYITPEKFSQSEQLKRMLSKLAGSSLLSRFIIDEAHCLSQWGHDFRPDYLKLSQIRTLYPDVPLMALTATANNSVVQDCMRILQMRDPYLHSQSFNRSNLRYSIRRKESDKKTVQEIGDFVLKHRKQSGIIYCLSRKDTASLAEELQKVIPSMRREITFYHADLPAQEKEARQRSWSKGDVKLICATIAFGMGINKPDVRYVIHHSMPKSLTNYYQESGRAGRDGETSHCVLYYSFKDRTKLAHMIHRSAEERGRSAGSNDNVRRQLDNLNKCVQYCIDEVQCRRVMLLEYFGEKFPRAQCDGTCDNCKHYKDTGAAPPQPQDLTIHAKALLHLTRVATEGGQRLTLIKLARYYGRSKDKESAKTAENLDKIDLMKVPELAAAGVPLTLNKDLTERLLQHLVIEDYLQEVHIANFGNYGADYISEGEHGRKLLPVVTPMGRYGYGAPATSNVVILLPTQRTRKNDGIEGMLPAPPQAATAKADKPAKKPRKSTGDGEPAKPAKGSKAAATGASAPAAAKGRRKNAQPAPAAAPPAVQVQAVDLEDEWMETQTAIDASKNTFSKTTTGRALPASVASAAPAGPKGRKGAAASSTVAAPLAKLAAPKDIEEIDLMDTDDENENVPISTIIDRRKSAAGASGGKAVTPSGAAPAGPASKKFTVPYKQPQRPPSPFYEEICSDDSGAGRGNRGAPVGGAKNASRAATRMDSETASEAEDGIYGVASSDDEIEDDRTSTSTLGAGLFDRRRAKLETKKGQGGSKAVPASASKSRQSVIDLDTSSSSGSGEESDGAESTDMMAKGTYHNSKAASATGPDAGPARSLLSKRQQGALQKWLVEYRKRWVSYWNYLSDQIIQEIVTRVPVTMDELAAVPGFGGSRARKEGAGVLATIYSFLETQDVIHLFPHAAAPTIPECPTWKDPFCESAEIIRNLIIEHGGNGAAGGAAADNQRRASYSQTQAPASYLDSSPAYTGAGHSSRDKDSWLDGSPPTNPSSGGGSGAPQPFTSSFKPQPTQQVNYGYGGAQLGAQQGAGGLSKASPIDVTSGAKAPKPADYSPPNPASSNPTSYNSYTNYSLGAAPASSGDPLLDPQRDLASLKRPLNLASYARPSYNAPPNVAHIPQARPPPHHYQGPGASVTATATAPAPYRGGFQSAAEYIARGGGGGDGEGAGSAAGAGAGAWTGSSGGGGCSGGGRESGGSEESQTKKPRVQQPQAPPQQQQRQRGWGYGDGMDEQDDHNVADYLV